MDSKCPNCNKEVLSILDGMLCNECWDISFETPISEDINWSFNMKKDSTKGDKLKLSNYPNSLENVNTLVMTGVLTTLTKDGAPYIGVSGRTGDKFMNGIKFIADGKDNKQFNLGAVAYGNELVDEINEFLKENHTDGKLRPFGRLMVECKAQANNYEKNGQTVYKNELVIKSIWNAPVRDEEVFKYASETVAGE